MKDFSFLEFIRDVGKHITVNYMMAKDSVKKRLSSEAKEGNVFYRVYLPIGYKVMIFCTSFKTIIVRYRWEEAINGGNITTGTELIRRIGGGKGYALTCPLITKADGTKFGKTEGGNIWLDAKRTSPYKFYQYWLNTSDADAEKYIKIFTLLTKDQIDDLVTTHNEAPHMRALQKRLAEETTVMVHSKEDLGNAVKASAILFGKSTSADLKELDENTFLDIFEGVPQAEVSKSDVENGLDMIAALSAKTGFLGSNGGSQKRIEAEFHFCE